jgi:hypothetical protein
MKRTQMKFFKYALLSLAVFVVGFAATVAFLNYKTESTQSVIIVTPKSETSNQITSAFSLENAPGESLRGQISAMTGEINWTDRIATEASKISSPVTIQQGEELSTGVKSSLSLIFPEVCTVKFSQSTDIQIIQTLPADIVFAQISGTGEYIKTGSDPLSVRALNLLANIDGDAVITINQLKPIVTLTVKSGTATVAYNDLKYVSHEVVVSKGKTLTFNSGTRRVGLK